MRFSFRGTLIAIMVFWAIVPAGVLSSYLLWQFRAQAIEQGQSQLRREAQQLAVEIERSLAQLQSQLIRLSEQGAVVKSASVSFLSAKANEQMQNFADKFSSIEGVILMDRDLFEMEVYPSEILRVKTDAIHGFIDEVIAEKHSPGLESVAPRVTLFSSPELSQLMGAGRSGQYLVFVQPVLVATENLSSPYRTDGALVVMLHLQTLVETLVDQAGIDREITEVRIGTDLFSWFQTPNFKQEGQTQDQQVLNYTAYESNPKLELWLRRSNQAHLLSVQATFDNFNILVAAFLLIIVLTAILVGRRMTVPLKRLYLSAQQMALGEYALKEDASLFDEVDELMNLMHDLGQTILAQFGQLELSNQTLEENVRSRTQELEVLVKRLRQQSDLMRSLMQLTVDIQQAKDERSLVNQLASALNSQFEHHRCAIVLNRIDESESFQLVESLPVNSSKYLNDHLESWRMQDVDFRRIGYGLDYWHLIPVRDGSQNIAGQLVVLGPELEQNETDVLFIMTRMMATMMDQIRLNRKLERLANTDALTGLANRFYFEKRYQQSISDHHRQPQTMVGIMVVDVDGLKYVNDNLGHEYGDQLIKLVADSLQRNCRDMDVLARVGGDEFYILMYGANWSTCEQVAHRLDASRQALFLEVNTSEGRRKLSVDYSYGIACSDRDPISGLIKNADARMYEQKKAHKAAN